MLKALLSILLLIGVASISLVEANFDGHTRSKRAFPMSGVNLWNYKEGRDYIIPYTTSIHESLSAFNETLSTILSESLLDFEKFTCIKFQPQNNETNYINIIIEKYFDLFCGRTFLGKRVDKKGQELLLSADCILNDLRNPISGVVIHELFHAIGFHHEHQRIDYVDFIQHHQKNVQTYADLDAKVTAYDLYSVSNYEDIRDLNTNTLSHFQPPRLSNLDIQTINKLYPCEDKLEGNGCYRSTLPIVTGRGTLSSNFSIYEQMEVVQLQCEPGFEPYPHQYSYCENGRFQPEVLNCRKIAEICKDLIDNCENITKANPKICLFYNQCERTCNSCGNRCYNQPEIQGNVLTEISERETKENGYFVAYCLPGYVATTLPIVACKNGSFEAELVQCVPQLVEYCDSSNKFVYKEESMTEKGERVNKLLSYEKAVECSKDFCLPLNLTVPNGQFYPKKDKYRFAEIVQLICDPGFEPLSSSIAKCETLNTEEDPLLHEYTFVHHKLQCVPSQCEDKSQECSHLSQQGFCEKTDKIGFMRRNCKKSCNLCGTCKSPPYHDRAISSIKSSKNQFANHEIVEIKCFNGYEPANMSTSVCTNGRFYPEKLFCKPVSSSCSPESLPEVFGNGLIYPKLYSYPDGYFIDFLCPSNSTSITSKFSKCKNGTFDVDFFKCVEKPKNDHFYDLNYYLG